MFKISTTFTINGNNTIVDYVADNNTLSSVLRKIGSFIVRDVEHGAVFRGMSVTQCEQNEVDRIERLNFNTLVAPLMSQHPEVVAISRDICPPIYRNVKSTVTLHVTDFNDDVVRLRDTLWNYYNSVSSVETETVICVSDDVVPVTSYAYLVVNGFVEPTVESNNGDF